MSFYLAKPEMNTQDLRSCLASESLTYMGPIAPIGFVESVQSAAKKPDLVTVS